MNRKTVAALLLTSLPALTGAAVIQDTATAATTTHVKRLVLRETAFHRFGPHQFAGTDRARSRATGKVVGFDTFTGRFHPQSKTSTLQAAFAFRGGLLLARVRLDFNHQPTRFTGRVIGGTGAYDGAQGSVSGRGVSQNRTFLTLRYSL